MLQPVPSGHHAAKASSLWILTALVMMMMLLLSAAGRKYSHNMEWVTAQAKVRIRMVIDPGIARSLLPGAWEPVVFIASCGAHGRGGALKCLREPRNAGRQVALALV